MKLTRLVLLPLAVLAGATPVHAQQDVAAQTEPSSVIIQGKKLSYVWGYRGLKTGVDVFESKRAELAPGASLRFVIRDYRYASLAPGAHIKVATGDTALTAPVSEDGGFVLPPSRSAYADDADLVLITGSGTAPAEGRGDFFTYPEPEVRSPNLPPYTWRMGDLRLQCHMNLAMFKKVSSFLLSMAVKLHTKGKDYCNASSDPEVQGSTGFTAPGPFDTATLIDGDRRKLLGRGHKTRNVKVPLSENWSNEARIVFEPSEGANGAPVQHHPAAPAHTVSIE